VPAPHPRLHGWKDDGDKIYLTLGMSLKDKSFTFDAPKREVNKNN
jgi:hypothetical protein